MAIGRRRFLALGLGGSAATLLATRGASFADAPLGQVWRLSADWGYAVPPKGRTRCKCSACHDYAANALFATQAAALAGRIHPCCVCQPFSVVVTAAGFDSLFPAGTTSLDLRTTDARARFAAAIPVVPPPSTTTVPAPTTTSSSTATSIADVISEQSPVERPRETPTESTAVTQQPRMLPTTGHDNTLPLIAAGVLAAGSIALLATSSRDDDASVGLVVEDG